MSRGYLSNVVEEVRVVCFNSPNVDAELALLLLRSTLEIESEDLIESLLSSSISDEVELDPSELFLFPYWNELLILSNRVTFSSSGSISITSFGGNLCIFSTKCNK